MGNINELYDTVEMHAGTGNSTWIFEAAKRNPKCRILFSYSVLAQTKEVEYIEWFTKINKRKPNRNEIPHFCSISSIRRQSIIGLRVPLIIDNSCFDQSNLQEVLSKAYKNGKADGYSDCQISISQNKLKIAAFKTAAVDFVNSVWIMPFRKKLVEKINNI